MNQTPLTPRIYVASLADYNAGTLHGRWIDASEGADHIRDEINSMLEESREPVAEDWAIHDYEGFAGLNLSEFEDIETVAKVAELLLEHGAVFAGLLDYYGGMPAGIEEAETAMAEHYCGSFDSVTDYAESFVSDVYPEVGNLPSFIRYHIDYEGIGRDLEMSGDIFSIECDAKTHIFRSY